MSGPLFRAGTVIQWSDGRRSTIGAVLPNNCYHVNEIDGSRDTVSEEYILLWGYPTAVQPGQIYQAAVHRYKVLAPLENYKWRCGVDSIAGYLDVHIKEFELLGWTLIEGLDVPARAPSRQHGPHTCPRCGHGGALIMAIRTVYCLNDKCPCYSQP